MEVTFQHADPQTWCEVFNDWGNMALKDDLETLKDFYLLRQSIWTKLLKAFGGGPEIPFFYYTKTMETENADGTKETIKESAHDFTPIRVKVHIMKRTRDNPSEAITVLVSKFLTHR